MPVPRRSLDRLRIFPSSGLQWLIGVAAILLALAAAGCSDAAPGGTTPAAAAKLPTVVPSAAAETSAGPYDERRNARADLEAALAAARQDHKFVLVDFGANWCPDCLFLDRLYRAPTVSSVLSQSYHVVVIDVGHGDRNMDLSDRFDHVADNGIPALVVLDDRGNVRVATKGGEFSNARTMQAADLLAFLRKWGPPGGQ